jgi:hypothetical protein
MKLLVNDDVPGKLLEGANGVFGEQNHLPSRSSNLAFQSESTAVILSQPWLELGGKQDALPDAAPSAPLHRISEMIVFPSHYADCDEIVIGSEKRERWEGDVARGQWIACRRGRLLIAIRPRAYSRDFGYAPVTLERHGRYDAIRWTFYDGEPRRFSRDEIRHTFGGFVAEHAGDDEYASLSDFLADLRNVRFEDFFWTTRRFRYYRPAGARRPALDMEASWSPGALDHRFATVNGRLIDPPRVAIDGLSDADFPFLSEPLDSASTLGLPYKPFALSWDTAL